MQIIHIISSLSPINFGIWNAALFGTSWLNENFGIRTRAWICEKNHPTPGGIHPVQITYITDEISRGKIDLLDLFSEQQVTHDNTIFVSHGCWLKPTRIGAALRRLGYQWLYVPHGMLEPWSLQQGRLKKSLYYLFFENRFIKRASRVRAVSEIEQKNLEHKLKRPVHLVENGVKVAPYTEKKDDEQVFLFMARLHYKKAIVQLVKAWRNVMSDDVGKKLIIAGPDEGELKNIEPILGGNIYYAGALYGDDKIQLLKRSHYYILPSFSEGFPTSVLEAMSFGLIPLISEGCNFHHVFTQRLGYKVEPRIESIASVLSQLKTKQFDADLSFKNYTFILNHYSEECIGRKLFNLYSEMIQSAKSVSLT